MFVSQIQHWIPETALILANVYKDNEYKVLKNTIGFYSSGFWLRKEIGNIDLKDNAYQNEANLLIFLIDYVNEFKDNKEIIYFKNNYEFIKKIVKVKNNKKLSETISKICHSKINKNYSWDKRLYKYQKFL